MTEPNTDQADNGQPQQHLQEQQHWLVRDNTIRWLWRWFIVVLALTVLAQLAFSPKGYFGVDGWFGFGAVFGFLACLAMVLVAKGLGVFLKRDEDYYVEGQEQQEQQEAQQDKQQSEPNQTEQEAKSQAGQASGQKGEQN